MIYREILKYTFAFIVFSLGGFCISCMYKTLRERRLVHPGLLSGPFIPVYGFGGLIVVFLRAVLSWMPLFLFLICAALALSVLEFAASWILESLLGLRLWDYSRHLVSVRGRVCFLSGTFWFLLSYSCLIYVAPAAYAIFDSLFPIPALICVAGFFVYIAIDLWFSLKKNRVCFRVLAYVTDPNKIAELPSITLSPALTKRIGYFLRILAGYPYLGRLLFSRFRDIPQLVMRLQKWVSHLVSFEGSGYRDNEAFQALIKPIVEHPAYERLKDCRYGDVSLSEYNISVAWLMFRVAGLLGLPVEEAVRGALFHRFYYHHDKERGIPAKFANWNYPEEADRHARVYFPPVTRREADMIRKAAWPLDPAIPRYPESLILSILDSFMSSRLRRGI